MRPSNPDENECWLLNSMPGDPDAGLAVLVLENNADSVTAAPLFMDDDDALPGDRRLTPEPDFLVGESWVALGDARRIPVSGFKRRLGEIPRWQATRLRESGCEFPRGLPVLEWLGDKRVETRASLCGALQSHVSPVREAAVALGRLAYDAINKLWSQVDTHVFDLNVRARPVSVRVRGGEKSETELLLAVPGGEAALHLEPVEEGWILKARFGVAVSSLELVDAGDTAHAGETFGEWWIFGEDLPVAAGECRLSWMRKDGEAAFVNIVLPSPKEEHHR